MHDKFNAHAKRKGWWQTATGTVLALRWARKGLGQDKEPSGKGVLGVSNDWEEASAAYSPLTMKSLDLVDENLLNYDLVEALVVHVVDMQSRHGPHAFLQVSASSPSFVASMRVCLYMFV